MILEANRKTAAEETKSEPSKSKTKRKKLHKNWVKNFCEVRNDEENINYKIFK